MSELLNNAQSVARMIMEAMIESGDTVIDATVGNGNDLKYLADKVGDAGHVFGFEIQAEGIKRAEALLFPQYEKRVTIIHDTHEKLREYVNTPVKVILYNLGYLPQSDHSITTLRETTLASVQNALQIVQDAGAILLVVYRGHAEGRAEWDVLTTFLKGVAQNEFNVGVFDFLNQANNPPGLITVQKRIPKKYW